METQARRWALSAGAALVVAVVLLSVWWLAQPRADGSGAGPAAGGSGGPVGTAPAGGGSSGSSGAGGSSGADPGEPHPGGGDAVPADPGGRPPIGQPPVGRDPVLVEGGVRVDSYAVRGDELLLHHTTGVPECYGEVALGSVEVGRHAVTVTLRSVPPPDPAQACIDLAVLGTTRVDLGEPLGGRAVRDGSYRPVVEVAPGGVSPNGT